MRRARTGDGSNQYVQKGGRPEEQHPAARHMPATYELHPKDLKVEKPRKFAGLYDDDEQREGNGSNQYGSKGGFAKDDPERLHVQADVERILAKHPDATLEDLERYGMDAYSRPKLRQALDAARGIKREGDGSNQYQRRGGGAAKLPATKDEAVQRWGGMIVKMGATIDGIQEVPGSQGYLAYTDNMTGSSLLTPLAKVTPEHIRQRLDDKRSSFGMSKKREVASVVVYSCSVLEGGPGSGIRSHINPSLTAEARSAYEGDGSNQYRRKGGSGRSKFAPDAHEPDEGVRVETPAVRAERIRSMKVDPVRAQVIRKAMGMPVKAALA